MVFSKQKSKQTLIGDLRSADTAPPARAHLGVHVGVLGDGGLGDGEVLLDQVRRRGVLARLQPTNKKP